MTVADSAARRRHDRRRTATPAVVRVILGGIVAGVASVPVSIVWAAITPIHRQCAVYVARREVGR